MKAIVLAAGYATRLHPLTLDRAKPLLEVAGRPLLSHLFDRIAAVDTVSEAVVVTNHRFAGDFRAWAAGRGGDPPIRLIDDGSTSDADKLGAVGDLALALERVGDEDDVLVAGGDNLLGFELAPFAAEFRRLRCPLLLTRRVVAAQGRYNEVLVDASGRVESFREKPADPVSDVAAICLYFFPPGLLGYVRRYLAGGGNPDAPGYLVEWLVRETPVHARPTHGVWFDIGSQEALDEARRGFAANVGSGV